MTNNDAPDVESSKVVASQSARAVDDQLIEGWWVAPKPKDCS